MLGVQHLIDFLFVSLNGHSLDEVIDNLLSTSVSVNSTFVRFALRVDPRSTHPLVIKLLSRLAGLLTNIGKMPEFCTMTMVGT
jgi:hypothetical protein